MATRVSLDSLIEYYQNLLIIQYNDKARARATIALMVRELFASGIIFDVEGCFDVDLAVGVQLDTLGKYIGVDRNFKGQFFNDYNVFGLSNAAEAEEAFVMGFSSANTFLTDSGTFLSINDVVSGNNQRLTDENYRFILKLKIIQNNSNHSHKSIDDSLFEFFGMNLYALSDGDMEMIYFCNNDYLEIIKVAIQKGVLTRPMGVGITLLISANGYFNFTSAETENFENMFGFSSAATFLTDEGSFLGIEDIIII
jgi:hypothetical protein